MGQAKSAGKGSGKGSFSGTVHHVDLEGGYYTLRTARGEIYKLDGGGADLRKVGARVEVEGDLDDKGFGISFGTPVLRVKSYKIL
ncbi:DUF5818 domain-containing protein [Haliangium sp. UPWRP_2]|uniref:DUF5818 domain-containing protein n=1 Tax=Haliangium sp. UPWRP_2 TaxID=1931276 RepID=UPI000D0E0315|nr:DUF5818 domain-containing protein [Haliangium sp. UPWRP_2]PSM31916.1 hypothetical protein BVG81_002915 [Haliangium sp. UPWRP_2]HNN94888.1 DUF5818 domain-containing protein [Pseudomonadota bacterium]